MYAVVGNMLSFKILINKHFSRSNQNHFLKYSLTNRSLIYAMLQRCKDNPILRTLNDQNLPYHYHFSIFAVDVNNLPLINIQNMVQLGRFQHVCSHIPLCLQLYKDK